MNITTSIQFTQRVVTVAIMLLLLYTLLAAVARAAEGEPIRLTKFVFTTTETAPGSLFGGPGFANKPVQSAQAGGHPQGLTTQIEFANQIVINGRGEPKSVPTADPKDIIVDVPAGLLGNPTAVPRCPLRQVTAGLGGERCPTATQVGIAVVHLLHGQGFAAPLDNVVPESGQSAEFGLETPFKGVTFLLTGHVIRTKEGYGLTIASNSISMTEIVSIETTFWGVPADPIHDPERGLTCSGGTEPPSEWSCEGGGQRSELPLIPFITWPSNCAAGPETATITADSWEEPGKYTSDTAMIPGVTGCNLMSFAPTIGIEPDTQLADAPVGLGVNLQVPQIEKPNANATPEMRKAVLTFPLGMSISPGIVDGIQACNESGPEGINFEGPESEEPGPYGEPRLAPGHCPDASIVGTAEAETPLLPVPVKGHIYLARPGCGNAALGQRECTEQDALDGNLYQLYLELGGTGALADTGVNLKVRLKTQANPATGQLTAVSEEIAQLPFSELRIRLNGGPRSSLDNPAACGPATTTADFTPWAAPGTTPEGVFMPGLGDATPSSYYVVNGCANPPGLAPGFVAGTVTPNAGKFSAFTLNLSRKDREQYIKGVQVHMPPGLLGMLSSVPLCPEAQANNPSVYGECTASKIGTTRVASGAGSHPFEIEGSMYLTGPHDGAPFGLSIVTNAVAGPFNLGKVVVRARIDVDPTTSAITITTDETGPYALPQIIFGVPLRLQRVTVNVDRPSFMFNPTNCRAQHITASISGSQEAVANVSSPFAAGECKSLQFKPKFVVTTSGRTSRKQGANLDAKLSYPKNAMGVNANIARVKVSLPKQLPSRLPTLNKACAAAVFAVDPAACPKESIVGIARSSTPLLPIELSGPVYFISHGGEEFPQLVIVLEGDGVRVDLAGSTFIRKGITTTTFQTVPDVPVNSFELYLPEGTHSALAANQNLCKAMSKLIMPTEFVAQNGTVVRQKTKIGVTGCGRHRRRGSKVRLLSMPHAMGRIGR